MKKLLAIVVACASIFTSEAQERPGGSVTAAQVTNAIYTMDGRYFGQPMDSKNVSLANVARRTRNGQCLRIANFGDDAFAIYGAAPLVGPIVMQTWFKWLGTIGGSGSTYYTDNSPTVTQNVLQTNPRVPIYIYGMPTGTGMTNRTAWLADTIALNYYASNAFGTLTVITNDGTVGGTWGTIATVNANNGSTPFMLVTNFSVAPGTWRSAVLSTGSNAVQYVGQYFNGIATNFLWDNFEGSGVDLLTCTTNAFYSNSLVTILSQYDLAIINEGSNTNQAILGYPSMWQAFKTRCTNTDFLFLQPVPATNSVENTRSTRQAYGVLAADYGLPVVDLGGLLMPMDVNRVKAFYTADGVHLSTAGNTILANNLLQMILNPYMRQDNAPNVQYSRGEDLTVSGTGVAKNNVASPGHSPWSDGTMFYQSAANAVMYYAINVPEWATTVTMEYSVYTKHSGTGLVYWQDTFTPYYSSPQGIVAAPSGSIFPNIVTSNSLLTYVSVTQFWPVTNAPKYFTYTHGASTNTAARGIVGPIKVTSR